jgi:hypothetical protein
MGIDKINEQIYLYFKKDEVNWETFDTILIQLTMFAMQHTAAYNTSLPSYLAQEVTQLDKVIAEFSRRGKGKEFATQNLLVYINFSAAVAQDSNLLVDLLTLGVDHDKTHK